MATFKQTVKQKVFKPSDYLKGPTIIGQNYTAWDTYGQGRPDFGKGAGPGDPYHEVIKKNSGLNPPQRGGIPSGTTGSDYHRPTQGGYGGVNGGGFLPGGSGNLGTGDPRIMAIRKRLGWV